MIPSASNPARSSYYCFTVWPRSAPLPLPRWIPPKSVATYHLRRLPPLDSPQIPYHRLSPLCSPCPTPAGLPPKSLITYHRRRLPPLDSSPRSPTTDRCRHLRLRLLLCCLVHLRAPSPPCFSPYLLCRCSSVGLPPTRAEPLCRTDRKVPRLASGERRCFLPVPDALCTPASASGSLPVALHCRRRQPTGPPLLLCPLLPPSSICTSVRPTASHPWCLRSPAPSPGPVPYPLHSTVAGVRPPIRFSSCAPSFPRPPSAP